MLDHGRELTTTATSLRVVDVINRLDGARMSEIAAELDLANSTVHGHLTTLRNHELLVKEGNEFHLGIKFFHLGEQARQRKSEYGIVRRHAHELSNQLNEEVAFAITEHGRSVIIFDENNDAAKEGFQVGRYFYMHNSASGKAMLAEWSRERVDRVIDRWGLPEETENTIGSREELYAELERTRERGYAINRQEALEGLMAIGTAITNPDGSVLGSLDVSGPPYRLSEEQLVPELRETVSRIETEIASQ
ncbi:IclR family transcriptional regulator [Halobellus marinus]|jgi:DNA-binding IclR family transcriptional regulator|uniref:IclR family transcriptional regulator n=1 Tax=Halobellus TaxID=1073986 RepID=UPI0028AF0FA9|nr:IclR family transcriptional regulator [Halobellus sp. DFY28]